MTRRLHLLTQYLWPDDAPTGIYAEQVADAVAARGVETRLVAGSGSYRPGRRLAPRTPIERLEVREAKRGRLFATALEHASVDRAFAGYLKRAVRPGDVVVFTSAPATTVFLHRGVRRAGATGVYWLQDFYPQLLRGAWDPPRFVVGGLTALWSRALASWEHVVKSAANLGYSGGNATVIRNWNTIEPGAPRPRRPRTALYSGNLGYAHDVAAFVAMCSALRDDGYEITVRGDGPGMRRLPGWMRIEPPFQDPADLLASYHDAALHLVAADARITAALFPSKLWNALALGRPVRASGFAGAMAAELEIALQADFRQHLPQWVDFLLRLLTAP